MCNDEKFYSVPEITHLLDISVASLNVYGKRLDLEPNYLKDDNRRGITRIYSQSDYELLKNYIETK